VEGSFRDEQRTSPNSSTVDRYQEIKLKGMAKIWEETTTITGDINYTGRNTYKALRTSLRLLGQYRDRDRLFALYSFNNYQHRASSSFSNAFQADYRRFVSKPLSIVLNTNLQRTLNRSSNQLLIRESERVAGGVEYLSQGLDSLNTVRKSGNAYVNYQNSTTTGSAIGTNAMGFIEWRKQYSRTIQVLNSHSISFSYLRYADNTPYGVTNQTINNIIYRPVSSLGLQNRLTFSDIEGTHFERKLEERGDVTVWLGRRLSLNSGMIIDLVLQPEFREIIYWTNRVQWNARRNLRWITQSSLTYNRTFEVRNFWIESTLEYRIRKLQFEIRARDEIYQDRDTWSIFMSATRIIGSGSAVR
jgi:hypothetical protein